MGMSNEDILGAERKSWPSVEVTAFRTGSPKEVNADEWMYRLPDVFNAASRRTMRLANPMDSS